MESDKIVASTARAGKSPIRVLIADDHAVVRQGLAAILAQESDMIVVAQADDGRTAIDAYRQHRPDVTLMDMRMPSVDAPEAIAVIRQEFRNARIVVLTTFDTDEDIYQCLRAGAMAYLLKGVPPEDLLETIRAAHAGQKRIPQEMAAKLTERMSSPELTARELEVLRLLVRGMSNKEIAAELNIEANGARHCNNLFQKLEVNDRTQAAMVALRRGLIRLEDTPP